MKKLTVALLASASIFCGCSSFVHVPSASLTINPKTGNVTWTSPKDTKLIGLSVTANSNGMFSASVTSWEDLLNPTNVSNSASGQADLVKANGQAITDGINAAANAAAVMGATAAKTAVKP